MSHAVFSPSASGRWIACPASHLRGLALPPLPPSQYSDRGTLLHRLAAIGVMETLRAMDMQAAAEGVVLEPDERAALAVYVKFVKGLRKSSKIWRVEQRVVYSEELYGTIDFFAVKGDTLHVVDFKGGRGIRVEALDNPQLLTYAMMVCELLDRVEEYALFRPANVHVHIVQPLYTSDAPIRGATYTRAEMTAWRDGLLHAMVRAKALDAPFNPGDHCRFCPVKPTCPALMGLAQKLPAPVAQDSLSTVQLAEWLTKADTIEVWIGALREHAHSLISNGTPIPGWKLVDKRATRKWSDEDAVIAAAVSNNIRAQELQLLSPAQLEKKYREIPLLLKPFIEQKPSGQNLVRDPATAVVTDNATKPALDVALLNLQYRV